MAEVVLFNHALGVTPGLERFADDLRAAGHTVHLVDLFEGKTFSNVDDGVAHAREIGWDTVLDRGVEAAEELPAQVVYGGFSLGVMPAQKLVQTRPGAKGGLFFHAAIPPDEFGSWPDGMRAQIHTMENDELGDVDVARELAADLEGVELFLYPGDGHLFADDTSADYDEGATRRLKERALAFLQSVG